MNNYYVYSHINLSNGEIFYIGKGKGNRRKLKDNRSLSWKNYTDVNDYDILLLDENLTNEDALKKEVYYISRIGRKNINTGTLVNLYCGVNPCIKSEGERISRNKLKRLKANRFVKK